jgi:hypothetical protein
MTGVGNFDGEQDKLVGYSPKCLTQRMGAADIDAVRTQSLACAAHITQGAATDAARRRRRPDRAIYYHGQPGTRPRLKQTRWFHDTGYHANVWQPELVQRSCGGDAHAVVLPIAIAEPNNHDLVIDGHFRCTVSVKKCAEHEMHGS